MADVQSIENAYDQYSTRKAQEFNKERILTEQSIADAALQDGNLPKALDTIQEVKEANGYTDQWANSMANSVQSQVAKYQEVKRETMELGTALGNNTVAYLDPGKQQKAFAAERERVTADAQAKGLPQDQIQSLVQDHMIDLSVKNNVIDKTLQKDIEIGLTGPIVDKSTGQVKDSAMMAYSTFLKLKETGNNKLVNQYAGSNKDLLYTALEMDGGTNPRAALRAAHELLSAKDEGRPAPKVSTKTIRPIINKWVEDELDTTFGTLSGLLPKRVGKYELSDNATFGTALGMRDSELESVRNNTLLRSRIEGKALMLKAANPNLPDKAAVRQAADETLAIAEPIFGNVVFGTPQRSVRDAMGIGYINDDLIVHAGLAKWLDNNASKHWKDYNSLQVLETDGGKFIAKSTAATGAVGALAGSVIPGAGTAAGGAIGLGIGLVGGSLAALDSDVISQSIADKIKGTPLLQVQYDSNSEVFIVDTYTDKTHSKLTRKPLVIPAKLLGQYISEDPELSTTLRTK
jgi:hypothetical protein